MISFCAAVTSCEKERRNSAFAGSRTRGWKSDLTGNMERASRYWLLSCGVPSTVILPGSRKPSVNSSRSSIFSLRVSSL